MLGVPVLVGSCAYAVAEGAGWRGSMADKPRECAQVLCGDGGCQGVGVDAAFRRFQRSKNAVLVSGNQWPSGTPSDPASHPPNQQPQSNGQVREFAATQVFRLGYLLFMTAAAAGIIITP